MAKLSVVIPARNEKYLISTIDDIFRNARGEVEVVAVIQERKPEDWDAVVKRHQNLHTIYFAESPGMRAAINAGAGSAISRGAKYLAKFDAHCCFGEGFDEILKADCDKDWVVIPRRKRLDPDTFAPRTDGRPDIDYHFLSFPDDVNDFGGPGLNGKVWIERAKQRFGKPEYDIDDEMASQGSGWFMHADYFQFLELMDEKSYGPFWNEAQEILNKCWLSGGRGVVNKKTFYAHWHKGSAGRGYHLPENWLKTGATFTKRWLFNDAWKKQTLPFKTLIERFWPVPTWPENWEELIYGKNRSMVNVLRPDGPDGSSDRVQPAGDGQLVIHSAFYGIGPPPDTIDVSEVLRRKVTNNSLDVCVTNADLEVGNPFRGQKKKLAVHYSYAGGPIVTVEKDERDWLVIGRASNYVKQPQVGFVHAEPLQPLPESTITTTLPRVVTDPLIDFIADAIQKHPDKTAVQILATTPASLIDLLIRRFQIPSHRLRGPMPIEVPSFHRNDLAKLFSELNFMHGAEIGVAEGNYSEVLLKANPDLHLLLVDPWHHYSGNPQGKTKEKNEYAKNETIRKTAPYRNVKLDPRLSMEAVRDVPDLSLDFVYIDGHHGFDYVLPDIIEWSKKVRVGGIIALDDYYYLDRKRWGAGVVEAVQAYTSAHDISPWFIFNGHKSVEAAWVKR